MPIKVHIVKIMVFPVVMYNCKSSAIKKAECWTIDAFKLWCWRRLLRVPWTVRRSNQSILKKPILNIGRTDAEAEAPVFWSSCANSWLIGKFPDAGKDWGQKEKRVSEDEMAGWHHQCNGHELGQTLGDGEGQWGLVCCSPWGHKELDMTERLSNNLNNSRWCLHCTYSASNIVLSILYLFTHRICSNAMGCGFHFKDEESGAQRDSDICPWSEMEEPLVDSKWQRWGCKFSLVAVMLYSVFLHGYR